MRWVAQSTVRTDRQNLGGYAPRDLKVALGGLRENDL